MELFLFVSLPLRASRNATKESLVQTYSDITESLMSINRLMSQQVQQSEGTVGSLGKTEKHMRLS